MRFFSQQYVACRVGFLSLQQRLGSSLVIVAGMGCVVGVSLAMLSLSTGLARTIVAGGAQANAIVLPVDAHEDYGSGLSPSAAATILNAPGIAVGPDGKPLGSAESTASLPPAEGFSQGSLILRGVGAAGAALRPGFSIISGRMFRSGVQELVVGRGAESEFGFKVGTKVILPNGEWPIVGEFTANGSTVESELWGDADTVLSANRISGYGSVLVRLTSPAAFDVFKRWLTTNPSLSVSAERQSDFLERVAYNLTRFFATLAYVVGCMMAVAALLGSVQIMYSAVEARTIEIGTLRAIGYNPLPVAFSVLIETIYLSLIGALLGSAVAWLLFNEMQAINGGTIFRLHISWQMEWFVLGAAVVLAVLGGLLPAVRAARLPVTQALRAT
jgi:putative ABC transport system permease protein